MHKQTRNRKNTTNLLQIVFFKGEELLQVEEVRPPARFLFVVGLREGWEIPVWLMNIFVYIFSGVKKIPLSSSGPTTRSFEELSSISEIPLKAS